MELRRPQTLTNSPTNRTRQAFGSLSQSGGSSTEAHGPIVSMGVHFRAAAKPEVAIKACGSDVQPETSVQQDVEGCSVTGQNHGPPLQQ